MFGWTCLDEFTWFALGERDAAKGPSDVSAVPGAKAQQATGNVATPSAIRKDAGPSRSPSATSVGTGVETGAAAQSPLAPTYPYGPSEPTDDHRSGSEIYLSRREEMSR